MKTTEWISAHDRKPTVSGHYPVFCYYGGESVDGMVVYAPDWWVSLVKVTLDEDGEIRAEGQCGEGWEDVAYWLPALPPTPATA